MDQAFDAEMRTHGLRRNKALRMLVDQFNANPWPLKPRTGNSGDLHLTWSAFDGPIETVNTFNAHCAAAGVSAGEGVRQLVQRCLDTASGKALLGEEAANG